MGKQNDAASREPSDTQNIVMDMMQDGYGGQLQTKPTSDGSDIHCVYKHDGQPVQVLLTRVTAKNHYNQDIQQMHIHLSVDGNDSRATRTLAIRSFVEHVQRARIASIKGGIAWMPSVSNFAKDKWTSRTVTVHKDFYHVAMPDADKRMLRADLDAFMASENVYKHMGLNWTRGYLLHGPPGCGKSSCISAISAAYKLPIHNVNLRQVRDDEMLSNMFASLPERALVVMEDIDCMSNAVLARPAAAREEPAGETTAKAFVSCFGVSLSGLLNVLDGIETGGGRVLVMTTNHKDALDPALVRPGRCDVHIRLGPCIPE